MEDKVFITTQGQVEDRIDPLFYINNVFWFLQNTIFKIRELSELSNYFKSWFWAGLKDQEINPDKNSIIHIRPTNIKWFWILSYEKNIYLSKELVNTKQNEKLQYWEVLFNNTNSQELVWKTVYFEESNNDYFCSNHITRIGVNKELVLWKYLMFILNVYQQKKVFFNLCTNWNNQSGIWLELLKSIKIPLPPIEIQNQIVEKMDRALEIKKQKEQEAKELLESINDYVLEELGIEYEEVEEKKIFGVSLSELGESKRMDVEINRPKGGFSLNHWLVKIGDIAKLKAWGTPRRWTEEFWNNWTINWLKSWELNDSLNITKISEQITEEWLKKSSATLFEKWTLLIAMYWVTAWEVGIIWVESTTNQAVCSIIPIIDINNEYLFFVLKLLRKKIRSETFWWAQPNISKTYLENLEIPLPPLEIQEKIATEVKLRIERAEKLQKEAGEIYESAKREVESIILS